MSTSHVFGLSLVCVRRSAVPAVLFLAAVFLPRPSSAQMTLTGSVSPKPVSSIGTLTSSASASGGDPATQPIEVGQPLPEEQPPVSELSATPDSTRFLIFFLHLVNLDAAADRALAEGNPNASAWKSFDQRVAGLTDEQGTIIKEVAYACNQALSDHDAALQEAAALAEEDLAVPPTGRMDIVSAAVEELQSRLGDEAFQTLVSYVHAAFAPSLEEVSVPSESGDSSLPVEVNATSPSVEVYSLIRKLDDYTFFAQCYTTPQDDQTTYHYAGGETICRLSGTGILPFDIRCNGLGLCADTFNNPVPGATLVLHALHGMHLRWELCTGPSGETIDCLEDPMHYFNPGAELPDFLDGARVPPLGGGPVYWAATFPYDVMYLARTHINPVTFLNIIPRQVTLLPGEEQQFISNIPAKWFNYGPGTINDTGLYKAPASVTTTQTDTVEACDRIIFGPYDYLANCIRATVNLQPIKVELSPPSEEVLPSQTSEFTATVTGASGLTVRWTLDDPRIGFITPTTEDGSKATFEAAPKRDIDVTLVTHVRACVKPPSSAEVCATAQVRVPKIDILFVANPPTHVLAGCGESSTLHFTAVVSGSSVPRRLRWVVNPPFSDGTLTVAPDTLVATYKAPTVSRGTVLIRACLEGETLEEFCSETYPLQIVDPVRIDSVTGNWNAGQLDSSFTLAGTGFSVLPTVTVNGLQAKVVSASDSLITGAVTFPIAMGGTPVSIVVKPSVCPQVTFTGPPIAPVSRLEVSPAAPEVRQGESQLFSAICLTAQGALCNSPDAALVEWTASQGTIDPVGLSVQYRAPASVPANTTAAVTACWSNKTRCAPSAVVTLLPPVVETTVSVTPDTATVFTGQTKQFTAEVTGNSNTAVTWSIAPETPEAGSIDQSGLYRAPATLGSVTTVTVIATSQADATRSDTATVTLARPPVTLTCTASPAYAYQGNAINWTATATGLVPATTQYALFRRKVGTGPEWTPPVATPAWQTGNVLSWAPAPDHIGTWEIIVWVKDGNTPANENGYGYAAYCNPGPVQVMGHPSVTSTPSPAYAYHGTTLEWTATGIGGMPGTLQYALFRRKVGTGPDWTPPVTSPAWQEEADLSWTPDASETGTWEIIIWVKDANTPVDMNGHGFAGYTNPGPVQVVVPPSVISTPSPTYANHGSAITWTATGSGGVPGTLQYALFRRKVGTGPDWTPPVTSPAWQSGNVLSWTPNSSENGTWEIVIWVKDSLTPQDMNGYGFAGYTNAGPVQVVTPLSITCSISPSSGGPGTGFTVIATPSGGAGPIQYAFFRRRAGTTSWIPDVNAPGWQASNSSTWTPLTADAGTWENYVWAKDATTKPSSNGYGYSAGCNPGPIEVLAPLTVTSNPSPGSVNHGTTLTWTATASGGTGTGRQYALVRKQAGASTWPSPVWQTSNVLTWTPGSGDVATWDIRLWVKDSGTPAGSNGSSYNPGSVQVLAPLNLTTTANPAAAYYGQPINWLATATGGVPATTQYALFRKKVGTTTWIPAQTSPAWQASNVLTWTPTSADVGTWDLTVWVRDGNTQPPVTGYAATYNPGQVNVVTPLTLTGTLAPASATYGATLTWTATASGGTGVNRQYAFFRRRAGTTPWTPDVTTPAWQTSNVLSWTPAAADVGTWETYIWVRDSATPPTMNTYGHAAWYNSGTVQIVAPLGLTCTPSPALVTYGNPITWTANASGGVPASTQYALFRRRVGTTAWIPAVTAPAWQAGNVLSWTPASADVATWELSIWVRDGNTPANMNTYGYAASCSPGPTQVVAPLAVTGTGSPASHYHGNPITWTATGSGGNGAGRMYAFFRKKVGTTNWIPAVTSPAWQASNVMSWTPASTDIGTWETSIWFKDANTPANANGYGYGAYYNPGPVQVFAHPTVSGTGSPGSVTYGTTITWTATGSGGTGAAKQYAFFRKKVGTSNWIPAITAPAWQTSNVMSWTPASSDVGTWETSIWLKDATTPPTMNGYGYAAYYNPGPVEVVGPLTITCGSPPVSATYGTPVTWSAYAGGGHAPTIQYAFFRRRVGSGTAGWIPAVTSPAWQSGNTFTWTPSSADVATWETYVWVRDANTPANMNTYGYAAGCNSGTVQVVAPLSVTGTGSPGTADCGSTITWTAYASGGYPPTTQYALFRRLSGTSNWIPAVTSPAWQSSNVLSWTPSCSDLGTWEIIIWVRDGNTPPTMNGYGYAAYYNAWPVQIIQPEYHDYPPTGWVDGWDSVHVWGWACDPDYPWESNRVDLWTTSWQWIGSADANGWSSAPINSACGGGYAHYFDFYHWGAILPGTEFWVWSIDLPYGSPQGDNWPIGGSGTGYEFVMP